MNTLILEPNTKEDYSLFVNLAKRLNVKYHSSGGNGNSVMTKSKKEKDFFALAGSLDLPETAEELIEIIESSRTTKDIDISWTQ